MNLKKLALVMSAGFVLGAGTFAGAGCSSSSSGGSGGGSGSSSGGAGDSSVDTGTGSDTGVETDSSESDSGASPDCGKLPTLHMNAAGDIYCGYGPADDAGGDGGEINCGTGTECCLGGSIGGGQYDPQACATWSATGAGCDNPPGVDGGASTAIGIACNQIADCTANGQAAGGSCCLQGATVATVAGCGYPKAKDGNAIVCETTATCTSGETQICSSQADCPSGMTCTAGKWKIYDIGFCQ
jgi:hypothetical protein